MVYLEASVYRHMSPREMSLAIYLLYYPAYTCGAGSSEVYICIYIYILMRHLSGIKRAALLHFVL